MQKIVIEICMEQTRLFQCNRFHCAENQHSAGTDRACVDLCGVFHATVRSSTQDSGGFSHCCGMLRRVADTVTHDVRYACPCISAPLSTAVNVNGTLK